MPSCPNSLVLGIHEEKGGNQLGPGLVFSICKAGLSVLAVELTAPETKPSARSFFTSIMPEGSIVQDSLFWRSPNLCPCAFSKLIELLGILVNLGEVLRAKEVNAGKV